MGKRSGIGTKKEVVNFDPLEMMDNLFSLSDPLALFDVSDSLIQDTKGIEDEPEALFYRDHKPNKHEFKSITSTTFVFTF